MRRLTFTFASFIFASSIRSLPLLFVLPAVLVPAVLVSSAQSRSAAPAVLRLDNGLQVSRGGDIVRVVALRDDVLRVTASHHGGLPEDASWAVLPAARTATVPVTIDHAASDGSISFHTKSLQVTIASDLRLSIKDASGAILQQDAEPIAWHEHGFDISKQKQVDDHFFGLGDKPGPLDHVSESFTMWNTDMFGWQESTDPIYKSIPFFIEFRAGHATGTLLDNTWRTNFDFGHSHPNTYAFGAVDGPLTYYFINGPEPRKVVETYAWLTGTTPLPPLWTLGFQQSRYSYETEDRLRTVANRLRADKIPSDALYLDIDYQDRNRPFTVNKEAFPDLKGLAGDLKAEGLHLVLITDLHIADQPGQGYAPYDTGAAGDHFLKAPDGKPYVGVVWPGPSVFPDFTRASTRAWWGGLYRDFVADGVSGFWNDMNEPAVFDGPGHSMPLDIVHRIDEPGFTARTTTHAEIHNIYGMENSRATYDGLAALGPDERPFVLTRASFAGGQRYAWTWTGDNDSTWNHLALSIPQLENLGMSGFAWAGADVGGYAGSPSPELLTRWIEVAAFTPMFRDHSGKGTARHEPWVDGPAQTDIRRRFIEARYRLMPYLYALADETSRTGLPVMRPLILEFPTAAAWLRQTGPEFMLGPDLLVAPQPDFDTRDDYEAVLPGTGWYDYWTGLPVPASAQVGAAGDVVHETPALDQLPVFVRPGSILPRQPLVQSTAERPDGPLELAVYPGPDCHGALYADDGHSLGRERGQFLRQTVRCEVSGGRLTVTFEARQGAYPAWWKALAVTIHGWTRPAPKVSLGGASIAATFDPVGQTLSVTLPNQAGPAILAIE